MTRNEIDDAIRTLSEDDQTEIARSILRRLHYAEVSSIVAELADEMKRGRVKGDDAMQTWVDETVDGHERVIYTARNLDVIVGSENWLAAEEMGETMPDWARLAYFALRADVEEEIQRDETIQALLRGDEETDE